MRAASVHLTVALLVLSGAVSGCGATAGESPAWKPLVLPASAELTTTVDLPDALIGNWAQDNPDDAFEAPVRTSITFEPDGTGLIGASAHEGVGATKIVELTYEVSGSTVTLRHEYGSESFEVEAGSEDYLRIRMKQESGWLKSGHLFRSP